MNQNLKADSWKKNIFYFLSAQTISLFGSSLVQYAIVWYITLSTSSGKMLMISTLCGFVPQIAISLFAGVWIDRYNRKRMIMLSDSIIAAATLLLALSFLRGENDIRLVFAILVIRSAGTGIQTPAVSAVLPQIVPKEHLMRVNGINSTLSSLMLFLSPAASGALLSAAPFETVLFMDVATAIIGVFITSTIRILPIEKKNGACHSQLREIREGFSYMRKNPLIRNLLLFQITILFLISPSAFLTPLLVSRRFGPEVWRLTASEMTYSLGMIAGGLLITSWGGLKKRMHTTLLAAAAYGCLMLGLGLSPVFPLYLLCNAFIGITSPCYNAPITVTLQERAEPSMLGRIFSLMQIASSCSLPLGMVLFGPLADRFPVERLLTAAGCLVLITVVLVWKCRLFDFGNRV